MNKIIEFIGNIASFQDEFDQDEFEYIQMMDQWKKTYDIMVEQFKAQAQIEHRILWYYYWQKQIHQYWQGKIQTLLETNERKVSGLEAKILRYKEGRKVIPMSNEPKSPAEAQIISEAWQKIADDLEHMENVEEYLADILKNLPPKCNYCDFFSGNHGIPRNCEYGICLNPNSIYHTKQVHEDGDCDQFANEVR